MRLYSHQNSTFSRRVRIYALERNLDLEIVDLDMARRAHRKAEHLGRNPYGRVPVLEDGDFILYESLSILTYLENKFADGALLPAHPQKAATTDMMLRLCDNEFANIVTPIYFAKRFLSEKRWNLEDFAEREKRIQKHFAALAQQLTAGSFAVNNQFGLVEIAYGPFLWFTHLLEQQLPGAITDWFKMFKERDSLVKTDPPQ